MAITLAVYYSLTERIQAVLNLSILLPNNFEILYEKFKNLPIDFKNTIVIYCVFVVFYREINFA
jgi:hypothetical protein